MDITRNKMDRAECILGVRLTLNGGDEEEYIYFLDQAKVLAEKI